MTSLLQLIYTDWIVYPIVLFIDKVTIFKWLNFFVWHFLLSY